MHHQRGNKPRQRQHATPPLPERRQGEPLEEAHFSGTIVDVTHLSQVPAALSVLMEDATWPAELPNEPGYAVGIDLEWRPDQVKNQSNPISLIQVSSKNVCVLFHMLKLNHLPAKLEDLLCDPNVFKVGVGIGNDLKKLRTQFGLTPERMIDIAQMARSLGYKRLGLQSLALDVLDTFIDRTLSRSNWATQLSAAQRRYAAVDAWLALELWYCLSSNEAYERRTPYWTTIEQTPVVQPVGRRANQDEPHVVNVTQAQQAGSAISCLKRDAFWQSGPKDAPHRGVGFDMGLVNGGDLAYIFLAGNHVCVVFHMRKLRAVPAELRDLLYDKNTLKAGINISTDLRILRQYGIEPKRFVDTAQVARELGFQRLTFPGLMRDVLNKSVSHMRMHDDTYAETLGARGTLQLYLGLRQIENAEGRRPYWARAEQQEDEPHVIIHHVGLAICEPLEDDDEDEDEYDDFIICEAL